MLDLPNKLCTVECGGGVVALWFCQHCAFEDDNIKATTLSIGTSLESRKNNVANIKTLKQKSAV